MVYDQHTIYGTLGVSLPHLILQSMHCKPACLKYAGMPGQQCSTYVTHPGRPAWSRATLAGWSSHVNYNNRTWAMAYVKSTTCHKLSVCVVVSDVSCVITSTLLISVLQCFTANNMRRQKQCVVASFPCRICTGDCMIAQESVQCDGCECWLHQQCVNMTMTQYVNFSQPHLQFFCKQCVSSRDG